MSFLKTKEWQANMAKKIDHMTSRDDDDLPPIRSGHVSMTKPVSGNYIDPNSGSKM